MPFPMPFLLLTLTMQIRVQGPAKSTRSWRLVTVTKVLSSGWGGREVSRKVVQVHHHLFRIAVFLAVVRLRIVFWGYGRDVAVVFFFLLSMFL